MSEYWVSHKRMNDSETRIVKVKAMKRTEEGLESPKVFNRTDIIESLENDNYWYTCSQKNESTWTRKEEIHIIELNGERLIRTDRNEIKEDNLGELPSF